jgi:hypothetical protein
MMIVHPVDAKLFVTKETMTTTTTAMIKKGNSDGSHRLRLHL